MENLINIQAEQYLLGALLNDGNKYFKIAYLQKEHFSDETNQRIFEAIAFACQNSNSVNAVVLKSKMPDLATHLFQLTAMGMGISNVVEYANLVFSLYEKRKLLEIAEKMKQSVLNPATLAEDIIEGTSKDFCSIQQNSSQYRMYTYGQVVNEIGVDLKSKVTHTSTGFSRLDYTMNGGFERTRCYALSAKPKAGKTLFKGTIANSLRKRNVPFLFIAAEMGRKGITKRLIASEVNTSIRDFARSQEATGYITQYKCPKEVMYFVDAPRITLEALKSVVINAVQTKNIEGFILDYLQLVTGGEKNQTIAQHQENVAQSISELCKKLNIWCLYSCQINREGEVRNGDGILMAVDWLYEIYRIGEGEENLDIYLKHIASRDMKAMDIGSEMYPAYRINNGVNILEYDRK